MLGPGQLDKAAVQESEDPGALLYYFEGFTKLLYIKPPKKPMCSV